MVMFFKRSIISLIGLLISFDEARELCHNDASTLIGENDGR
jgi:hypothetical protein